MHWLLYIIISDNLRKIRAKVVVSIEEEVEVEVEVEDEDEEDADIEVRKEISRKNYMKNICESLSEQYFKKISKDVYNGIEEQSHIEVKDEKLKIISR